MNRIRAGYCTFPNPFNRKQIVEVSLRPEDVDVIVFWSKDPKPLIPYLDELDSMGLRYYFQFTVNGYPKLIEPGVPQLEEILRTFGQLSERVSPERVIWRYDPILWGNVDGQAYHGVQDHGACGQGVRGHGACDHGAFSYGVRGYGTCDHGAHDRGTPRHESSYYGPFHHVIRQYHEKRFREIAKALRGKTRRVVVSLVDDYRGAGTRLARLARQGIYFEPCTPENPDIASLLSTMAQVAEDSGMEIVSCAEEYDLRPFGIKPGKCIDDEYIERVFGISVTNKKDPHQRTACGCVQSKDIGVYGTCLHGCVYCYAMGADASKAVAGAFKAEGHDVSSPSLVWWYERSILHPSLFQDEVPNHRSRGNG